MSWKIHITDSATKELRDVPTKLRNRITVSIDEMAESPFRGDIKKLAGNNNVWRRRIGSYRIFYTANTQEQTVFILGINRRTSSTY